MRTNRSFIVLLVFLACAQVSAANGLPEGRYRVVLSETAIADEVFRGCACTIDRDGERFVIVGSAATALRLARDPRVTTVEQLAGTFAPAAEARDVTSNAVASWSSGAYSYDGAGNIVGIGADRYSYDGAGRLATSTTSGVKQEYTYDRFGNLTSTTTISSTGTQIKSGAVASNNRLSGGAVQYDLSGRLTAAPNLNVQYDDLDMPTETASDGMRRVHLYSAGDERIATLEFSALNNGLTGTEWTIRDTSGKVLRRLHQDPYGSWSWKQDYIYRDGALLAAEVATAERTLHFFLDHLGTPRLITNHTGAQVGVHKYYPFGAEQTSSNQDREDLKFTGHERDTPALDYMHARYYGVEWGRFLSVDPKMTIEKNLHIPQRWNRYAYVVNNPLKFVDPDGRDLFIAFDFSKSNLGARERGQIMGHVRQAFVRAGVNTVYVTDARAGKWKEERPTDRAVTISITARDLDPNSIDVVFGRAGHGSREGKVSTHHANKSNSEALVNLVTNVTAHEVGHASGALPEHRNDAIDKNRAQPGSIMEQGAKAEDLEKERRDFDAEDAQRLRDTLNPPQ